MSNKKTVSVIIPTYNDWDRLKLCVEALKVQTYPSDLFEVIIVNNDPMNQGSELILPDNFQQISEAKPGSYAARNAGIKIAKGEILAFTDSDCIPAYDWIEQGTKALNLGVDLVAGKVNLFYKNKKLNFAEIYEKAYAFRQDINASKGVSVTANLIVKRSVFEKIGYFDSSLLSGGDFNWTKRATTRGYRLKFFEKVIINHPSRNNLSSLIQKNKRKAGGNLKQNKGDLKVILKLILLGFFPPFRSYVFLLKRADLTRKERVSLIFINYYIKIFSTINYLKLLLGLKKASRT